MNPTAKRWALIAGKLGVSALIYWLIYRKIAGRENVDELWQHVAGMSWAWVGVGILSLCCAIVCSVVRWNKLLVGQGIHAPYRHLVGSFMVGRFFGAVAPGGFTGLNGYRIYDIATHTGKTARSVASIGIEMVLGNLAMGIVAFVACFFGYRYVGGAGMAALLLVFSALIGAALAILWKPTMVRRLAGLLPPAVRQRVQSMVDAVCAYEGKGKLLSQAAVLGCGTHTFNSLIYVCAARALHVELSAGEIFFVSTLQIVSTLAPISINGIGLREATAIGLYTIVGLPAALGFLIPNVGFVLVEMSVSSLGGLVLLLRGGQYKPEIRVEDAEHERALSAAIERVAESEWPKVGRGAAVGLGAGLFGGLLVGLGEAIATVATAGGAADADVWFYGALTYGLFCGALAMVGGAVLAFSGRLMERAALPEPSAFAHITGGVVAGFAFVLGLFRIRRDVFHEELVLKSGQGLAVLAGCAVAALVVYVVLFFALRALSAHRPGRYLLRPAGSIGFTVAVAAITFAVTGLQQPAAAHSSSGSTVKGQGGNVLFIVVDTLRADRLPAYGYGKVKTPHLDAFVRDSLRFDAAFSNSSWTRPSFASLLTGRYASNHGVMSKASSLPEGVTTLAEQFRDAGYATKGVVTNVNVSPFFNFHQGFDEYTYLAPKNVLGASDTASRMLLPQVVRKVVEKLRAMRDTTLPGYAYHDAPTVNAQVVDWLDRAPDGKPWLLFVGYMDPHDPYFEHPYNGVGYSRAAHDKPAPEEAERLSRLYDGEIAYWDEHFGALVADLKRRRLYDDLTIVVTSDHGEEFMEHGGFWHGTTLYDEQVHVPLLLKLPGNREGGKVERQWVQSVDIMPTLLRLQQLQVPEGVQGGDLFRGSDQVFAEESHERNVLKALRTRAGGAELKLITANPGNPRGLADNELYAVSNDPGEQKNLAPLDPDRVAELTEQLGKAEERAKTGAAKQQNVDTEMDEVLRERLKGLGYIQSEDEE